MGVTWNALRSPPIALSTRALGDANTTDVKSVPKGVLNFVLLTVVDEDVPFRIALKVPEINFFAQVMGAGSGVLSMAAQSLQLGVQSTAPLTAVVKDVKSLDATNRPSQVLCIVFGTEGGVNAASVVASRWRAVALSFVLRTGEALAARCLAVLKQQ